MTKKEREIKEKINAYIKRRREEGVFPSLQGLMLELDVSEPELIKLARSETIKRELNMLKLLREDWLLQKLLI